MTHHRPSRSVSSPDLAEAAASDLPLDHALALLLADETENALRWGAAVLESGPWTPSALVVTARLLDQMGRRRAAIEGLQLAVQQATAEGNLPLAMAAIGDLRTLGADVADPLEEIASAFCQGSERLQDAQAKPLLPQLGEFRPLSPFLTGPALASKAAQILESVRRTEDARGGRGPVARRALAAVQRARKGGASRSSRRLRDAHRAGGTRRHPRRGRRGGGLHRGARRARSVAALGRRRRQAHGHGSARDRIVLRRDGAPLAAARRRERHRDAAVDPAGGPARGARGGGRKAPRGRRRARGPLPAPVRRQPRLGVARRRRHPARGPRDARRALRDAHLRGGRQARREGRRGSRTAPHRVGRDRGRSPTRRANASSWRRSRRERRSARSSSSSAGTRRRTPSPWARRRRSSCRAKSSLPSSRTTRRSCTVSTRSPCAATRRRSSRWRRAPAMVGDESRRSKRRHDEPVTLVETVSARLDRHGTPGRGRASHHAPGARDAGAAPRRAPADAGLAPQPPPSASSSPRNTLPLPPPLPRDSNAAGVVTRPRRVAAGRRGARVDDRGRRGLRAPSPRCLR